MIAWMLKTKIGNCVVEDYINIRSLISMQYESDCPYTSNETWLKRQKKSNEKHLI